MRVRACLSGMRRVFGAPCAVAVLGIAVGLGYALVPAHADDGREEVAPGLYVGDVLDQTNWQLAKGLLPEEILRHYEKGEYRNQIVAYPVGSDHWEQSFLDATKKNAGRLAIDDRGTIVDKKTGQQAPYYYGIPFPQIDANDPKAGVKIAWNQFLAYWYGGSSYNRTSIIMLNPKGIDRTIAADGWFNFWDGQAPKYRRENPLNLQYQFLGVALKPTDLQGTASLTWRYRDPTKRDSVWAFVPALRRVRAVSPANRSDGYLGSDISGDDEFFFNGKPEDFDWKLIGKHDGLRIVDPSSAAHELKVEPAPGGGWVTLTDRNPATYGFSKEGWKGLSWAPVDSGLAKRPMWIIEAVPHDKYYLYGRIELWIDANTWDGSWNRKFTWRGEPTHLYQMMARINQAAGPPGEQEWVAASTQAWACAENTRLNRATLSGMRADPKSPSWRRVHNDAQIFDPMALQRFGK